ncbi:MAG: enoyl-CoA hydratase/isomerase family protein [Gammaproteobacteria bacterium]
MSLDRGLQVDTEGAVALLTLTRPDALNALNSDLVAALQAQLDRIAADGNIRAVILAGAGRGFCAGADLKELSGLDQGGFARYIRRLESVCASIERLPQPVVAAVHGIAFGGGCELTLACDLRCTDATARFGLPEIKLGMLPGAGGMQRAARLLPTVVARRMILTGDPISAVDAAAHGFAEAPVPAGEVMHAARQLAGRLAEGPPLAHATAKMLLRRAAPLDVQAATEIEQPAMTVLFGTADAREGIAAFIGKRGAKFTGT